MPRSTSFSTAGVEVDVGSECVLDIFHECYWCTKLLGDETMCRSERMNRGNCWSVGRPHVRKCDSVHCGLSEVWFVSGKTSLNRLHVLYYDSKTWHFSKTRSQGNTNTTIILFFLNYLLFVARFWFSLQWNIIIFHIPIRCYKAQLLK
jgi:hypothetical protein